MEIKKKLDETDEELLELAIIELRERFQLLSRDNCSLSRRLGWKYKITFLNWETKAKFSLFVTLFYASNS
jgi:hypothetical protein